MYTKKYKRRSVRRLIRGRRTRRSKKGGQQLWRIGSQIGQAGNWSPDYFKLGANHNYKYPACSLSYSSIRDMANKPDHGFKIKK